MPTCTNVAVQDVCPTKDQIIPQLLALLPRGRARGTHDGGPRPTSVLYLFWYAFAAVLEWVNTRICALPAEFFCATQVETRDLWMEEYGLPDGCDPYPDLCTKVAALGGSRCDYYQSIAARAGWTISCWDINDACGGKSGVGQAGCAIAGRGLYSSQLFILVNLGASPAYSAGALTPPLAGRLFAGGSLACPPDLTGLQCLLARIVGAHMQVIYGTM